MVPTQDKIGQHGHFIKKCSLIQEMLSLLSIYTVSSSHTRTHLWVQYWQFLYTLVMLRC